MDQLRHNTTHPTAYTVSLGSARAGSELPSAAAVKRCLRGLANACLAHTKVGQSRRHEEDEAGGGSSSSRQLGQPQAISCHTYGENSESQTEKKPKPQIRSINQRAEEKKKRWGRRRKGEGKAIVRQIGIGIDCAEI